MFVFWKCKQRLFCSEALLDGLAVTGACTVYDHVRTVVMELRTMHTRFSCSGSVSRGAFLDGLADTGSYTVYDHVGTVALELGTRHTLTRHWIIHRI
jgi:hypothetical protein